MDVAFGHAFEAHGFSEVHKEVGQVVGCDLFSLVLVGVLAPDLPEVFCVVVETV